MKDSTKLMIMGIVLLVTCIAQRHQDINILTVEFTGLAGTILIGFSCVCSAIEKKP